MLMVFYPLETFNELISGKIPFRVPQFLTLDVKVYINLSLYGFGVYV